MREPRDSGMLPVNPLLERSLHIRTYIHTYQRSKKTTTQKFLRESIGKLPNKWERKSLTKLWIWRNCGQIAEAIKAFMIEYRKKIITSPGDFATHNLVSCVKFPSSSGMLPVKKLSLKYLQERKKESAPKSSLYQTFWASWELQLPISLINRKTKWRRRC